MQRKFHRTAVYFYLVIMRGSLHAQRVLRWVWQLTFRPIDWITAWADASAKGHIAVLIELDQKAERDGNS